MIRRLLIFAAFILPLQLLSQTGIGTTAPHTSAKLEVASDKQGFLPPRVTLTSATDNTTITNPAEGLLVYNKGSVGLQAGYYYWNGANWATIATASSAGNGVTAMDMVKLYSKAYSAASGDIAHSGGYSFTVPVSGRYLFDFSSTGFAGSVNVTMTFKVRQGNTDIGTDLQSSYNNSVHVEYNGKIEVNLQAGITYNVFVTTTGYRDAGDYDRVYYKMIAGNLPVTGQSVDYVSVTRTGSDQTVNTGNTVVFNTINGGNIPYNTSTGLFTLTAGKTYKLTGVVSLSNGNTAAKEVNIVWKNAAGDVLGSKGELLSPSAAVDAAGNGTAFAIYTPTSNTTVSLNVNFSSSNTILWQNFTFAIIEQIGSSAFVNPWVLSGNDVYNMTGKVGIGTNSPTQALDVTGDARVTGTLTSGGNTYPTTTGANTNVLSTNGTGALSWSAAPPIGSVISFAGSTAPVGYMLCNGASISRTTYASLFSIIGTTYGAGDGSTTFNLPDLRSRMVVGVGQGTGLASRTLAATGGEENHTLTINEMPSHKHNTTVNSASEVTVIGGYAASSQSMFFGTDRSSTTGSYNGAMSNTGGGASHNVMNPFLALNYIIKF